jgi:O-antigen ligase
METAPTKQGLILSTAIGAAIPLLGIGKSVGLGLLALGSLLVLWELRRAGSLPEFKTHLRQPLGYLVVATFIAWTVSALGSVDLGKSMTTLGRTAGYVLMTAILYHYFKDRQWAVAQLGRGLLWSTGFVFLLALSVVYAEIIPRASLEEIFGKEFDLNGKFKSFGSTAICLLPVLLVALTGTGGRRAAISAGCFVLTALVIWNNGKQTSNDAILGAAIAVLFLLITFGIFRIQSNFRRAATAVVLAVGVFIGGAVIDRLPVASGSDQQAEIDGLPFIDTHREIIWGFVFQRYREAPIFGVGPDAINKVPGAKVYIPGMQQEFVPSHPHNWLLEVMAETGTIGTMLMIASLLLLLKRFAGLAFDGRWEGWAAVALFGAYWGSSLANFSMWASWWQLTFLILSMILLANAAAERGSERGGPA